MMVLLGPSLGKYITFSKMYSGWDRAMQLEMKKIIMFVVILHY